MFTRKFSVWGCLGHCSRLGRCQVPGAQVPGADGGGHQGGEQWEVRGQVQNVQEEWVIKREIDLIWPLDISVKINDKKLCARDLNNRIDACQGDSGGPLIVEKQTEDGRCKNKTYFWDIAWNTRWHDLIILDRFFLIGVVSFGYKCAVPGFPGVYSRVTSHEDWIREVVARE